jgi:hypothetical protein
MGTGRMMRMLALSVTLLTATPSTAAADSHGSQYAVLYSFAGQCFKMLWDHVVSSPDNWYSGSAESCTGSADDVKSKVKLMDSNFVVIASCDSGAQANWAACRVQHDPTSGLEQHIHVYHPGTSEETVVVTPDFSASTD